MTINVQLFAAAREQAGAAAVQVDLPRGSVVADLRRALGEKHPQLGPLLASALFAVDATYADDQTALDELVEIACIPPVSGG